MPGRCPDLFLEIMSRDLMKRRQPGQPDRHWMTAVEKAAETVIVADPDGSITYVNPAFERTTGYSASEAIGRNPRFLKSGAHSLAFYRDMWRRLHRGETWGGHFINRRKDGTLYHEEATISPVKDENDQITSYVAVKRDITRETTLEQQFYLAQKMEAVGQLAGGIAHNFLNLLGVVLGYTELIKERTVDKSILAQLEAIHNATNSAAGLTRQLLAFGRRQVLAPRTLDLNAVLAEAEIMLRGLLRDPIRVLTFPGQNLGQISADPGQLQEIIINLALNARDAMPQGGTLTLETRNILLTEEYKSKHSCVIPGEYVLLSVSDTGVGMTPAVQERIFEPFFTTKSKEQGTGLGLATVYGTVKQSGGYIWVYSEPGHGTTFKIYFPVAEPADAVPLQETVRNKRAALNLSGTALLVEDRAEIREVVRAFVEDTGLTVIEAENAEHALQLASSPAVDLRLLLTDMVLPQMDGVALAEALRQRFPQLKIVFMTGYSERSMPASRPSGSVLLSKPFPRHDLLDCIAVLLEDQGPGTTS